jgi:uncharacterized tellurite resistance protein B-like protein
MADWRKLAKAVTLADGKIDSAEAAILRKELFADGKIDQSELDFLNELRNEAKSCSKEYIQLFIDGVKANILADGDISDAEAAWLRKSLYADGKIDADEKRLLKELKSGAKKTGKGFQDLCKEAGV